MIITRDKKHEGRLEINLSERELKKIKALMWTVQNTVLESIDVQIELEENLQYFNIGNECNRDMSRRLNFDKLFRNVIDSAEI